MNTLNSVVIPLHSPRWEENSNYCLQSRRNLCFLKSCYHSLFYWCQNYSMWYRYLNIWQAIIDIIYSGVLACCERNITCQFQKITTRQRSLSLYSFPYRGWRTELVCFCLIPTMHSTTNYLAIENRVAMFCFLEDPILPHMYWLCLKRFLLNITWFLCTTLLKLLKVYFS